MIRSIDPRSNCYWSNSQHPVKEGLKYFNVRHQMRESLEENKRGEKENNDLSPKLNNKTKPKTTTVKFF